MQPLAINVAIVFGTRLTVTNFLDVLLPWIFKLLKYRAETKGIAKEKKITPAEENFMLLEYDNVIDSITNYADTAVQYGFTVLFVTALPIAAFLALGNNYMKVKIRAWKLFRVSPPPHSLLLLLTPLR
jgi:hypothetical protein